MGSACQTGDGDRGSISMVVGPPLTRQKNERGGSPVGEPPRIGSISTKAYGFLVAAESIFLADVSIFLVAVSIFMAAESIFMPVSAAAGAGAIAGAAVSVFGASLVLQAATSTAAATRARRFL